MTYTKKELKLMEMFKELLLDKTEEAAELEGIDLVPSVILLEERIEPNSDENIEDINIELLIEDFIKLFAYKRELSKRAIKINGGE